MALTTSDIKYANPFVSLFEDFEVAEIRDELSVAKSSIANLILSAEAKLNVALFFSSAYKSSSSIVSPPHSSDINTERTIMASVSKVRKALERINPIVGSLIGSKFSVAAVDYSRLQSLPTATISMVSVVAEIDGKLVSSAFGVSDKITKDIAASESLSKINAKFGKNEVTLAKEILDLVAIQKTLIYVYEVFTNSQIILASLKRQGISKATYLAMTELEMEEVLKHE